MNFVSELSREFNMREQYVDSIIKLIDDGNTIPFIARYRKEMTGSVDDQILREFADRLGYLRNLEKRKADVTSSITEQGKMTDVIAKSIADALTITEVDDIYRPFRPKRKTRASEAIRKGLSPLADIILMQNASVDIEGEASAFLTDEVTSIEDAINGARDIIAETISDDAEIRKGFREDFVAKGFAESELKKQVDDTVATKYDGYANFRQEIAKLPSHRILAMNRGEKEDVLRIHLTLDTGIALRPMFDKYLKTRKFGNTDSEIAQLNPSSRIVYEAIVDGYDRLILPSIEREVRSIMTDTASEQAIKVFDTNLRSYLMTPPLRGKVVLGLDPAYRTGCKIAVVDKTGAVLATTVVFPTPPQNDIAEATEALTQLIDRHKVDVIAIGNGTASKESEIFVSGLIKLQKRTVEYAIVNEAGASVYSASKLGAEEFPDYDVAKRSAISIARRLQDPLSELIKIDTRSIGVGQYQHDMPQARLGEVLDGVVEDCVNSVGVDLNTASYSLLSFVSGLNKGIAKSIVSFRDKNGAFMNRGELLKVAKLGDKAFEQCAGFLRIVGGQNILDNTGVHPESYDATDKLLSHFGMGTEDVSDSSKLLRLPSLVEREGASKVASLVGVGEPTLRDIVEELQKPGRDIRDSLPQPILRSDVMSIDDLAVDMEFNGTVRNVIDFGAFVDIGVHQDGLVHISQLSNDYVKHPSDVVKVGDIVKVKIIGIDKGRNRISLTMKI